MRRSTEWDSINSMELEDEASDPNDSGYPRLSGNRGSNSTAVHDEDSEDDPDIYMAIVWQQGKFGAAFYATESCKLYVTQDYSESPSDDFVNCRTLLLQVAPQVIVSMAKMDKRFSEFLRATTENSIVADRSDACSYSESFQSETVGNTTASAQQFMSETERSSSDVLPFRLELIPNQEFSFSTAKQRISLLNLPDMPSNMDETERAIYFSSIFPADSVNSVRAVGALLKYLSLKRINTQLEEPDAPTPILGVEHYSMENIMLLNRDAFFGLQIFSPLSHPSVYKAAFKYSGKESLSLRNILQTSCLSSVGRRKMAFWLLRPLQNLETINERLKTVSLFCDVRNVQQVTDLQTCIRRMRDLSRIFLQMANKTVGISEWKSLLDNLRAANDFLDICAKTMDKSHYFKQVFKMKGLSDEDSKGKLMQLREAIALINQTLDFQESAELGRCVVKNGVDELVDKTREKYGQVRTYMSEVAELEYDELRAYHPSPSIQITFEPELGFFLIASESEEMRSSGDYSFGHLQFHFVAHGTVYYKSDRVKMLDDNFGRLGAEVQEAEIQVLIRLQKAISLIHDAICHVNDCGAQIDCLLAFAACASRYGYICPKVTDIIGVDIVNGRHPLQELTCKQFIPNHTKLGGSNGSIIIVTGPNSSGKSVYLKQIALIVYMAHLGCYVPAEKATIGLCDRIYSRIKTLDSVSAGLSAFVVDLNQVIPATLYATQRSLIILDEFGKGTDLTDGAALLAATINRWIKMGNQAPQVVVSTHFLEIIHSKLLIASDLVTYLTTQVTHQPDGKIVFLFKLIPGQADGSLAAAISQEGGMPDLVVARAKEAIENYSSKKPIPSRPIPDELVKMSELICESFLARNYSRNIDVFNFLKDILSMTSQFYQPSNRNKNCGSNDGMSDEEEDEGN